MSSCSSDDKNEVENNVEQSADVLDYSATNANAWHNYMQQVATRLKTDADDLYTYWFTSYKGGEPFSTTFTKHNSNAYPSAISCIEQIIDGCCDIANEVGTAKIGEPYDYYKAGKTTQALYAVESWYSWHSRDDYSNNIISIYNSYLGKMMTKITGNEEPNTNSISAVVAEGNAELDAKVRNTIKTTYDAILAIPQPFRNNIVSTESEAAMEACENLNNVLERELKPYLQANESKIGDERLNAIVNQYVDAVVEPTYKNLKEKVASLVTAVATLNSSRTNANFTAACNAWLEARQPWETSEAFLFGPVADQGLDPNMDSWPLDQEGIVNVLKTGNWNEMAFRVGKFKTPFTHGYLTTLGETLLPQLPTSLTASVILPYSLNAVTPNIGTGFDIGVEMHGLLGAKVGYEVGIFNGTGSSVNTATKTFSDDWHIPSLLYAGRVTLMPKGVMPSTQGNPDRLNEDKWMVGLSTSLNVESENESTNDYRAGVEFAMLKKKLYLAAEAYYMHVGFTERQKIDDAYNYWGGYIQGGYFVTDRLQLAARYDIMDRNGSSKDGLLNMPAIGFNYFIKGTGMKLQAMYQYTGRTGHETQLDRDNDDLGLTTHSATIQLQYCF